MSTNQSRSEAARRQARNTTGTRWAEDPRKQVGTKDVRHIDEWDVMLEGLSVSGRRDILDAVAQGRLDKREILERWRGVLGSNTPQVVIEKRLRECFDGYTPSLWSATAGIHRDDAPLSLSEFVSFYEHRRGKAAALYSQTLARMRAMFHGSSDVGEIADTVFKDRCEMARCYAQRHPDVCLTPQIIYDRFYQHSDEEHILKVFRGVVPAYARVGADYEKRVVDYRAAHHGAYPDGKTRDMIWDEAARARFDRWVGDQKSKGYDDGQIRARSGNAKAVHLSDGTGTSAGIRFKTPSYGGRVRYEQEMLKIEQQTPMSMDAFNR